MARSIASEKARPEPEPCAEGTGATLVLRALPPWGKEPWFCPFHAEVQGVVEIPGFVLISVAYRVDMCMCVHARTLTWVWAPWRLGSDGATLAFIPSPHLHS